METRQVQGKGLRYLDVRPDTYNQERDYPLVILLHGFGAHMGDLAGLAPAIESEGYVYVFPNGPLEFDVGFGTTGYGWTPPRGGGGPEEVSRAVIMLDEFLLEVLERYHVSPGNAVLGGFSQGGTMTYRCGLGKPEVFAGLAALSSTIPDPEEISPLLPAKRIQPIFISHGLNDNLITPERARHAKEFLEAEGYAPVYREYPIGHEISQDVLDDLVSWLHQILPPLR